MLLAYDRQKLAAAAPDEIGDALEQGHIVYFPECPVVLPEPGLLAQLRAQLPAQLRGKNISYHPEAGQVRGLAPDSALAPLVRGVLVEHRERVTAFLRERMPALSQGMRVGTSSFRPLQEQGRKLSAHASNELIHVDAGAYGATHGDRILRFFVNVNPVEDRVWASKGSLPELFAQHAALAGLRPTGALEQRALDRLRSALLAAAARAGLAMAPVLDSSPYDRAMRRLHNYMKDTPAFQADPAGRVEYRFPPYSAWMVFTDMVSHACLSGQHALIWTALVPLASCRHPEMAPFNLLRAAAYSAEDSTSA